MSLLESGFMGLRNSIREYFNTHPRAKKALGVATAIASNFAMVFAGPSLLAATAGTIVDARQNKEPITHDQLMSFFKDAIQDPLVQESIMNAVREGGADIASNVSIALNQLEAANPGTGRQVQSLKSELTVIAQQLGIIRELISYYEIPNSSERVKNIWRLPAYLDDVLVIDEGRRNSINAAIGHIANEKNVVILGEPGSGKTTVLYAIWKELENERNTALVWDTKDVSRVHEKDGIILFNDDLPETRELMRAIVERDVKGIVTTARIQEWSRLPTQLRELFVVVTLPKFPDITMVEIAKKHLESQSVEYDEGVVPALIESAQGSPIYIRYLAEEIGVDILSGKLTKLTEEHVRRAPKGMTDYVATILARILFDLEGTIYKPKEGSIPVIKSLLCLADMPSYETHEVHLNQLFFALKGPSDSPGPFNAIKQYLSRDPRFYSLKFMHDTLADVLRGGVDHPIVGDIRLIAQEMGVAGRRNIEKQALVDGWEHVKAEYEIDPTGGLDPLLSYAYFSVKNFGLEYLDQLALKLANEYLDNPLSQGLFAISGPLDEIPEAPSAIAPIVSEAIESDTIIQESEGDKKSEDLGQAIMDAAGQALGEDATSELAERLKGLEKIPDIASKIPSDLGEMISKKIEEELAGVGSPTSISAYDKLNSLLAQDSVSPRKLSRALSRLSTKVTARSKSGKLTHEKDHGELLVKATKRLFDLDSYACIEILDAVTEAMSYTIGEVATANILTELISKIAVAMLDEKTRKEISNIFDKSIKRCKKVTFYKGMRAFLEGKWKFFGINTKDLNDISNEIKDLMQHGRAPFALETLTLFSDILSDEQYEHRLGLFLKSFKNLERAVVNDRPEFDTVVKVSRGIFKDQIQWMKEKELLHASTVADLGLSLVTSTFNVADRYVKKMEKTVSPDTIYPHLHGSIKQLVLEVIDILKEVENQEALKDLLKILEKSKYDSDAKAEMITALKD